MDNSLAQFANNLIPLIEEWSARNHSSSHALMDDFPFENLALELFARQFENVPAYQKWCISKKCTPDNVGAWHNIPVIPAFAYKYLDLSSLSKDEKSICFQSSGTTSSERSQHYHSLQSVQVYEASLLASFEHFFLKQKLNQWKGQIVSLIPEASSIPNSSLGHMVETIRKKHSDNVTYLCKVSKEKQWILDSSNLHQFASNMSLSKEPICLLGTAFSYVHLIDWLKENQLELSLPTNTLVMETGGYKGQSRQLSRVDLHQLISDSFKISHNQIITEYGMSELSSQAYRSPGGPPNPFQTPPWMRVRIIDPESGRPLGIGHQGLIQVFDLANVWSVCALETEDIGAMWENGFEVFGRSQLSEPKGCSLFQTELSSTQNS